MLDTDTSRRKIANKRLPVKHIMKSLRCFCDVDCSHYKLVTLELSSKIKLIIEDVYTDSEDDNESRHDITSTFNTTRRESEIEPRCENRSMEEADTECENFAGRIASATMY